MADAIYPSEDYTLLDSNPPNFTFAHVDVKEELVKTFLQILPKHNFPDIKVIKSDPQTPAEIPCIGINRASDDESNQFLTDTVEAPSYDTVTQEYTVKKGTYFQESIELRVWHTNADMRDKLYPVVKATILAMRETLTSKGLRNINIRGGRDEQDTSMQSAALPLYWASVTISFLNPLEVSIVSIAPPITEGIPAINLIANS